MSENIETKKIVNETDDERRERFKIDIQKDSDAVDDQREKSNEDMRFINVSGGMWEGFLEDEFSDRTKLEFDIISNFINRFIGQWNQNRVDVEFKADDSKTSDDDAELLNGIYRADYRQFSGKMSVDNAVDETVTCGYGAFELATQFENEDDPENDLQRIIWRPIHNAYNTIYWDNSAKRIDKRDAKRCTKLIRMTKDSFLERWPDEKPVSAYTPNDNGFPDSARHTGSDLLAPIYVAKRYEIVRKKSTVFVYNNLQSNEVEVYSAEDHEKVASELKKDEFRKFVREREMIVQHVDVTLFSGDTFLKPTRRIAGRWIPIIPMYGYHAYVDGQEWWRGLVRDLMDAQRLFNMQVSQLAENSASNGQEIPIFTPDQMDNADIKAMWKDRNNKSYLLANPILDSDGNVVHQGPIGYLKPSQLDGSTTALMQIVPAFVQDKTGGAPQDTVDPDLSGKAIRALQKREDLNTQVISDNIANSIEWSGVVFDSMASDGIYTVERMMNTIGKDGAEGRKQLLLMVLDEKTGKPVQSNDLNGKKFRVYADVGPQYDTLKEQTVEDLKGMLDTLATMEGGQQYLPAMMSTMLENITGVGLGPLKEMNRRIMIVQGLIKPETDEEKEMLAQAQQPQQDPNQKLIDAAALQAEGEAQERQSKVADNVAAAGKKTAETQQIISETKTNEIKTLADIRQQVFENTRTGTLQ